MSTLLISILEPERQRFIQFFHWRVPPAQSQYFSEEGNGTVGYQRSLPWDFILLGFPQVIRLQS